VEPVYDVVWPRSPLGIQQHRLAPRLSGLDGTRVALLWDHLFRGDELFPLLTTELRARFPRLVVVDHERFGNTHGSDEADVVAGLAAELRAEGIDAVVSGVGC